jgi:hypothetical protein
MASHSRQVQRSLISHTREVRECTGAGKIEASYRKRQPLYEIGDVGFRYLSLAATIAMLAFLAFLSARDLRCAK